MLKVFLAEDEFVVREGIKNNINWAEHGYEFCGEASDGELAFPMIQRLKPDIVITDIKMPFMDGLELSRLIKKELPQTEIIILSGYAEFDYAKEAIRLGVAHYLTKPISGDDLIKEIDKLSEKIREKAEERALKENYEREMAEKYSGEKRSLFGHLVLGDRTVSELIELADSLDTDISASAYDIVLLQLSSGHHKDDEEYSGSVVKLYEDVENIVTEAGSLIFDRNLEGKAIIFKGSDEEDLKAKREECLEKMKKLFEEYEHVRYYAGIGVTVNRLTELPESFATAAHAYAGRYFTSASEFRIYSGSGDEGRNDNAFSISSLEPAAIDGSRVKEFLHKGQKGETAYFLEEFFNNLGEGAMDSSMFRQYIAMNVYFTAGAFLEEQGYDRHEIEPFDVEGNDIKDVKSVSSYLEKIIDAALDKRDNKASNRYAEVIDEVKAYIEENYSDEELSLNKLSSVVNFSPNHLSMVFSNQMGMPFIKYLTDFRINKAKELLRCTSKRSVDISLEVGYKDPHYFSYLFKKTVGMTPTQYRSGDADPSGSGETEADGE